MTLKYILGMEDDREVLKLSKLNVSYDEIRSLSICVIHKYANISLHIDLFYLRNKNTPIQNL